MTIISKQPSNNRIPTVEKLTRHVEPVLPETGLEKIYSLFSGDCNLRALPVVKEGRPVGLISRYGLVDFLSQPLPRNPPECDSCAEMMDAAPLLVEKSTPIHELSGFLSESEILHLADSFIITEQGSYTGIGHGQDLLREITKAQVESARYANPLTSLPGYVPIDEHIEYLLQSGKSFTVCYGDLDNLRAFNDVCGYHKGNELIRFTAALLANISDPALDYIGHIGGDDFIMVLQSTDWEQRCHRALSAFAHTSFALFDKEHRAIGGYLSGDRQGRIVHHPLPTLSIGGVRVNPGLFRSHHEVTEAALAAKRMAKLKAGNSLFVERRRQQLHDTSEGQHENAGAYYYG